MRACGRPGRPTNPTTARTVELMPRSPRPPYSTPGPRPRLTAYLGVGVTSGVIVGLTVGLVAATAATASADVAAPVSTHVASRTVALEFGLDRGLRQAARHTPLQLQRAPRKTKKGHRHKAGAVGHTTPHGTDTQGGDGSATDRDLALTA